MLPIVVRLSPSVPLPVPVEAVTVYVDPPAAPVTPVIAGVPPRPVLTSPKLPTPTPLTFSLNVTVQETVPALVGLGDARTIEDTVGGVRSIVYRAPTIVLASLWPLASSTPVREARFSPSVPLPVPSVAVTVHVADGAGPLLVTLVIVGVPPSPTAGSVKLAGVRPETGVSKVTVQERLEALVGLVPASATEETCGGE